MTLQIIESPSPETEIRLVDGFTQWDGRVEILHDKTWGAVCGNQWSLINTGVRMSIQCYNVYYNEWSNYYMMR